MLRLLILLPFLLSHATAFVVVANNAHEGEYNAKLMANHTNALALRKGSVVEAEVVWADDAYWLKSVLEKIVAKTGEPVHELHLFGHGQGSLDPEVYNMDTYAVKMMIRNGTLSKDIKFIFHGCMIVVNRNINYFVSLLPPEARVYGHRLRAQIGQPFDWVLFKKDPNKNKVIKLYYAQWEDPATLDVVVPRAYALDWAEVNSKNTIRNSYYEDVNIFRFWLAQNKIHTEKGYLPKDVIEIMQSYLK